MRRLPQAAILAATLALVLAAVMGNHARRADAQAGGVPAAPTGLRVTSVTTTNADLAWTDNATNETKSQVAFSPKAGGVWQFIDIGGAGATGYTMSGLQAAKAYYAVVRACNASGCSSWSNSVTATTAATDGTVTATATPPPSPTALPPTVTTTATATPSPSPTRTPSPTPTITNPTVVICQDINFGGWCQTFTSDAPSLGAFGMNDQASSIRVSAGATASLYEHDNYQGVCETFTQDVADLTSHPIGNDIASSLRVGVGCPTGAAAPPSPSNLRPQGSVSASTISVWWDYSSTAATRFEIAYTQNGTFAPNWFTVDTTTRTTLVPNLNPGTSYNIVVRACASACSGWSNGITTSTSSVSTPTATPTATSTSTPTPTPTGTTTSTSTPPPTGTPSSTPTSTPSPTPTGTVTSRAVTLCKDIWYSGGCVTLSSDTPNLGATSLGNSQASSIKVPAGVTVSLYDDTNYNGNCQTFTADYGDFTQSQIGNDRAASLKFAACPPPPPPPTVTTPPAAISGLRVQGNRIVNAAGQDIILRGVNYSGGEYMCIQGRGVFDGPTNQPAIDAMKTWKVQSVRLPMNEDCWLDVNMNNVNPAYRGANYKNAFINFTNLLVQNGIVPIIELHWSAPGTTPATGQTPMPNRDHSIDFWRDVAATFKGNTAIVFDLFNEPYPDNNSNTDSGWACWANGCNTYGYQAVGFKELTSVVRGTGAQNLILLGGLQYSNALAVPQNSAVEPRTSSVVGSRWLANKPSDPNIAASWHIYPFNQCVTAACWDATAGVVALQVPVVATEIGNVVDGNYSCTATFTFLTSLMTWLDSRGLGYLAWTWNTWGPCPQWSLITDFTGAPTPYGAVFKAHLAALLP